MNKTQTKQQEAINLDPAKHDKNNIDIKLGVYIAQAIETESTFKMYAYRVISPEQFMERMQELQQATNHTLQNIKS